MKDDFLKITKADILQEIDNINKRIDRTVVMIQKLSEAIIKLSENRNN